jgi:hypothetical protein
LEKNWFSKFWHIIILTITLLVTEYNYFFCAAIILVSPAYSNSKRSCLYSLLLFRTLVKYFSYFTSKMHHSYNHIIMIIFICQKKNSLNWRELVTTWKDWTDWLTRYLNTFLKNLMMKTKWWDLLSTFYVYLYKYKFFFFWEIESITTL